MCSLSRSVILGLVLVACGDDADVFDVGTEGAGCYSTGNCRGSLVCTKMSDGTRCVDPAKFGDGGVLIDECSVDCDDAIGCTDDSCVDGVCKNVPDNGGCNEGQVCDLEMGGCVSGDACAEDVDCADEEDVCKVDERCLASKATCVWDVLDGDDDGVPPEICGGADSDDADPSKFD